MTYDQFSISQIELTIDQADVLVQECIRVIEKHGPENMEKETVFDLFESDPIKASLICKIHTEYESTPFILDQPPEPETISKRSVDLLSLTLFNENGDDVIFKVIPFEPHLLFDYLTIKERIESYFKI